MNINLKKSLWTLIRPGPRWRPMKEENYRLVQEFYRKSKDGKNFAKQNEAFEAF